MAAEALRDVVGSERLGLRVAACDMYTACTKNNDLVSPSDNSSSEHTPQQVCIRTCVSYVCNILKSPYYTLQVL